MRSAISLFAITDVCFAPEAVGHERPEIIDRGHGAGTDAKDPHWFCAGSRMEWLQARLRLQKGFSRYRLCQQELTDEKAPLFGL
jgi:hypothetical protein